MRVKEWMEAGTSAVAGTAPVEEARRRAEAEGLAVLFVVDENQRLLGFVTRKALSSAPSADLPVAKLASVPQDVLSLDDPLERASLLLEHYLVLPVVDEERRLVGVLSKDGLLRALSSLSGLGIAGTRISIRPKREEEIYRALNVLEAENLPLVAVLRGCSGEIILHVQNVEDPEGLRAKLQEALG